MKSSQLKSSKNCGRYFEKDTSGKHYPMLHADRSLETIQLHKSLNDTDAMDRARMASILQQFNDSASNMNYLQSSEDFNSTRSSNRPDIVAPPRMSLINKKENEDPESWKSEIANLRQTVYRLNIQLSDYQKNSLGSHVDKTFLPGEGPAPPWLVCSNILCPLLTSYDETIMEKEEIVSEAEEKMRSFEAKLEEIIEENDKLHATMQGAELCGPGDESEWAYFIEQAKIVLKENSVLSEQLTVQQEKFNYLQRCHEEEVSNISHQLIALKTEKKELETELVLSRQRYSQICLQTEELMESKSTIGASNEQIYTLKNSLQNISHHHESGLTELTEKLKKAYEEEKILRDNLAEMETSKRKLEDEIIGLKKALKECQKRNGLMKSVLKNEMSVKEYLDSVIAKARDISQERDEYAFTLKQKEKEFQQSLERMISQIHSVQSIPELDQVELSKPIPRLEAAIKNLVHETIRMQKECKTQNQRIHYLNAILKEKEENTNLIRAEKRNLEDKLNEVLNSALDEDA